MTTNDRRFLRASALSLGVFALACMAIANVARAADRPMFFENVTLQDGLSQNSVMSVLQDSHGFLWFATEKGLNRYDGYGIRSYVRDARDRNALRSDYIWAIDEDAGGDLWLATQGGGIARWNRRTDTFENFGHDPENPQSLASDLVRTLLIDGEGIIWVGTRESGLDRFDPASGTATHFRHDPANAASLSSDSIFSIYEDRSGHLWVATDAGLNRFVRETGTFVHYRHNADDARSLSDDRIVSLFEDHRGSLWVGTFEGGLNRLDRVTGRVTRYDHDAENPGSLSDPHVRAIFEDDSRRLWVGTANGLNLLDRERGTFDRYNKSNSDANSLPDNYIMSITQDRGGVLWVGTRSGGVSKWNPRSWMFGHVDGEWLRDANIASFADEGNGRVWFGSMGEGLFRVNLATLEHENYRHHAENDDSISDDRVMSLLFDRKGNLWIGTMAGGLNRMAAETGRIETYRHDPNDPTSLGADGVMSLLEDSRGRLWVGTFGGGVSVMDPVTRTFRQYRHDPAQPDSLSNPRATDIVEDLNGAIWVATDGGGLNLLKEDESGFTHFRHVAEDPTSLNSDSLYALHIDAERRVWVGTSGDGLNRLVGSSRRPDAIHFESVEAVAGLADRTVYGILSDAEGRLWLSGNHGLKRFDPNTGAIRVFHRSHGLQGEEFNFGAYHRGSDGTLYFGGARGFNAFQPALLEDNDYVAPVVLTSFEKLNSPAETDRPYDLLDRIALDYKDDVVTFEFAALDFTDPRANQYAYRLEGFDEEWIDVGNRRRVTYTNLAVNDYVFRVRAANSDGNWNHEGLNLAVSVAPAPWQTGIAYAVYAVLTLALVIVVWRQQRRKLNREAEYSRRLEVQVRDRTQQLEERNVELQEMSRAKSEFLARMSHEIRTPMNGVLGMTELLLSSELDDTQTRFANTIHNSADTLLQIINDILDFSKIEAGKLQLESVEFDLCELLEETIDLLSGPAFDKGLELMCAAPADLSSTVTGDPLRVRQILVNLVGNAVKFTDDGEVVVKANVCDEDDDTVEIRFEVADTGVGIDERSQAKIFELFSQEDGSTTRRFGGTGLGLAICRQLVEMMGGEIGVESRTDAGSTFWFTVRFGRSSNEARHTVPAGKSMMNPRVLVANANDTGRAIIEDHLTGWNFDWVSVDTGARVLSKLVDADISGIPFDIIILDERLPDMNAARVVRGVRGDSAISGTKVLLMHALASGSVDHDHCEIDVDGCVSKPVRQSDLYNALAALCDDIDTAAPATLATLETAPAEQLMPQLTARVLLVEDHPVNQAVAQGMLAQLGCDVSVASDGREAVQMIAGDDFDLVLMDCQMPVMDGYQATTEIRRNEDEERHTPIIALTANALAGDRDQCLAVGMDDYLAKPFTQQALCEIMDRWLDVSVAPNRPEAPAARRDVALIDDSMLDAIRTMPSPDGQDLLSQVVDFYLESSEKSMNDLRAALDREDTAALFNAAHALKSSSANLGARQFAELCRQLEQMGRLGNLDLAETTWRKLFNLYPRVISALQLATGRIAS